MTEILDVLEAERRRLQAARLAEFMRYTVEVCRPDWTPAGTLRGLDALSFTDRYCTVGIGSCNAPATTWNEDLLERGGGILVRNGGIVEQAGLYERTQSRGVVDTLKLNWKTPEILLDDRVCYADPAHPATAQTRDSDDQAGYTSTVIYHYVNVNAGPGALPERRIGGLRVRGLGINGDPGLGVVLDVPVQANRDNLLQLIARLAIAGGVGFRIDTRDRAHLFTVYQVADLSRLVEFSAARGTMGAGDGSLTAPTATTMFVLGDGKGAAQQVVEVSSDQGDLWQRRIERVMSEKGTPDALAAAGARALADKGETLKASFEAVAGAHEGDIRLGDLVTVVPWVGESAVKPVVEKRTKVTRADGRVVTFLAGDYGSSTGTQSEAQQREQVRLIQSMIRRI